MILAFQYIILIALSMTITATEASCTALCFGRKVLLLLGSRLLYNIIP